MEKQAVLKELVNYRVGQAEAALWVDPFGIVDYGLESYLLNHI